MTAAVIVNISAVVNVPVSVNVLAAVPCLQYRYLTGFLFRGNGR